MSHEAHPLAGRAVLVVEDDYFIADGLRRSLQVQGAAIVGPVPSVDDALALIANAPRLDAAVLDLNLQGEMTFTVADALSERGVPFVFATGYDRAVVPERYSGIAHCEKPVQVEAVVKALADRSFEQQ